MKMEQKITEKKPPLYYRYGEFIYRGRHIQRLVGGFRLLNDFNQRINDFKTPQDLDTELDKQEVAFSETIIK